MSAFFRLFCLFAMVLWSNNLAAISAITLSGSPGALTINAAVAGSNPTSVTDATTAYSILTTATLRKITGKINTTMPTGVTLNVRLTAPSGAVSAGFVSMTKTNKNLVTNITALVLVSGLSVTYQLSATVAAAQVAGATRTLTLTVN